MRFEHYLMPRHKNFSRVDATWWCFFLCFQYTFQLWYVYIYIYIHIYLYIYSFTFMYTYIYICIHCLMLHHAYGKSKIWPSKQTEKKRRPRCWRGCHFLTKPPLQRFASFFSSIYFPWNRSKQPIFGDSQDRRRRVYGNMTLQCRYMLGKSLGQGILIVLIIGMIFSP